MTDRKAFRRRIHPDIDRAAPAFLVIERFGGPARFCELTGFKMSTVHDWLRKGLIPANRQEHILTFAQANRIAIRPADFVPLPQSRVA